jgi:hypothetical protein
MSVMHWALKMQHTSPEFLKTTSDLLRHPLDTSLHNRAIAFPFRSLSPAQFPLAAHSKHYPNVRIVFDRLAVLCEAIAHSSSSTSRRMFNFNALLLLKLSHIVKILELYRKA